MVMIGFSSIIACLAFVAIAVSNDTGGSGGASTTAKPSTSSSALKFRANKWVDHLFQSDDTIFGDSLSQSLWGTYQPDKYFAMKTRSSPFYLQSGIFWKSSSESFRFGVKEDELAMMRYDVHDGKSYGKESLVDVTNNMNVTASFAIPTTSTGLTREGDTPTLIQSFFTAPITNDLDTDTANQRDDAHLYYYFGGGEYPELEGSAVADASRVSNHNNAVDNSAAGGYSLLQVSSWAELNRQSCLDTSNSDEDENEDDDSGDGTCSVDAAAVATFGPSNPLFAVGKSDLSGWFLLLVTADSSDSELSFWCPGKLYANSVPTTMEILAQAHKHLARSGGQDKKDKKNPWFEYLTPEGRLKDMVDATCTHTLYVQMRTGAHSRSAGSGMNAELFDHLDATSEEEVLVLLRRLMAERSEVEKSGMTVPGTAAAVSTLEAAFHEKFRSVFGDTGDFSFMGREGLALVEGHCKRILSDLLGGVGFWVGVPETRDSRELASSTASTADQCSPVTLHCSSPSRTSFPRGFLWDEGFHQMLMSQWDPSLSLGIIDSWLSAQYNTEFSSDSALSGDKDSPEMAGFIPREMILGQESRGKVPGEFIPQFVDVANPPTLLLAIQSIMTHSLGDLEWDVSPFVGSETADGTDSKPITAQQREILCSLSTMYPKLHSWVQWFLNSQQSHSGSQTYYRWKGRIHTNDNKERLLTNTLASGLDDYPRAEIASDTEEHVDLLSWMAASCKAMRRLGGLLRAFGGADAAVGPVMLNRHIEHYTALEAKLTSRLLDNHWSSSLRAYVDTGLHDIKGSRKSGYIANKVVVKCGTQSQDSSVEALAGMEKRGGQWALKEECPPSHPVLMFPLGDGKGGYLMRQEVVPSKQYRKALKEYHSLRDISDATTTGNSDAVAAALGKVLNEVPRLGYVSLFPFLLKLIPIVSVEGASHGEITMDAEISALLGHLGNSSELWSDFGIRSLSKTDLFYNKGNAPYDQPYWRAPIWMPLNYLVLDALRYYARKLPVENANQGICEELYKNLRLNLINNILIKEYTRTGYLWEHYSDAGGDGMRGHPFNGWTSLIVNVLYEKYIES